MIGDAMVSVAVPLILDPPPASAGRGCAVSELNFLQGRGTDGSIMGSAVINACLLNVSGEGLQDLQDLIAVVASAEQGECQVAGHLKFR